MRSFKRKRGTSAAGGGKERQEEQRKKKKLTAFERMNLLFDSDSFVELDQFVLHECADFGMEKKRGSRDGVITGYGMDRWPPSLFLSHDFTMHLEVR